MVLRRRGPDAAGVVDEDVDVAQLFNRCHRQRVGCRRIGQVGRDRIRLDTMCGQRRHGFVEIGLLARADDHPGALLAQCQRHLQAQAARAAGDQRRSALQAEKLLDGCHDGCHLRPRNPCTAGPYARQRRTA